MLKSKLGTFTFKAIIFNIYINREIDRENQGTVKVDFLGTISLFCGSLSTLEIIKDIQARLEEGIL